MTDLEISKALALAIGHRPGHVHVLGDMAQVWVQQYPRYAWSIRVFDYRDWNIIGPIAAECDCFPYRRFNGTWDVQMSKLILSADTPQKAIALAVIKGAKA